MRKYNLFQNHWDFLMQFKDQSFHFHPVPLLVVTNSFKIPSHRAPQIHENTSNCCPNHFCLVSIICIKHFCIFIVSDHKTMAVGDNILQRGTNAGQRKSVRIFTFDKFDASQHCNFHGTVSNHCKALFAYERSRLKEGSLLYVRIHSQVISMNI